MSIIGFVNVIELLGLGVVFVLCYVGVTVYLVHRYNPIPVAAAALALFGLIVTLWLPELENIFSPVPLWLCGAFIGLCIDAAVFGWRRYKRPRA
jgi:hypothetical protein